MVIQKNKASGKLVTCLYMYYTLNTHTQMSCLLNKAAFEKGGLNLPMPSYWMNVPFSLCASERTSFEYPLCSMYMLKTRHAEVNVG